MYSLTILGFSEMHIETKCVPCVAVYGKDRKSCICYSFLRGDIDGINADR